jgi:hypothetical protein
MAKRRKVKDGEVRNLVVVSDLHCGCRVGLCPPRAIHLDDGGTYKPSRLQRKLWNFWEEFWGEWVPRVTRGEPYHLCVNGDALDGVHHGSVTQVSHNMVDQLHIAEEVLAPIVSKAVHYYHVRGTEAHVGKSGQFEEMLAKNLGAVPGDQGEHARWEMWGRLGPDLVHVTHHIGTTGSVAYETTAIMKELSELLLDASRWDEEPPDVVVRSHRHRGIKIELDIEKGGRACPGIGVITPGWQLKTPFAFRIPGGRAGRPQFGGILVRSGDEEVYSRSFVRSIKSTKETKL